MAYFIANRGATIGGGSLGRTEQLPSLKILCVDLCARYVFICQCLYNRKLSDACTFVLALTRLGSCCSPCCWRHHSVCSSSSVCVPRGIEHGRVFQRGAPTTL